MSSESDHEHPTPIAASPSWKELTDFVNKQAEQSRAVIDYWFKLAIAIIGLIVVVAAGALGALGFQDANRVARDAAEDAARSAARISATKFVQDNPDLLVNATIQEFKTGEFASLIQAEVQNQVRQALLAELGKKTPSQVKEEKKGQQPGDRRVIESVAAKFIPLLRRFKGTRVRFTTCPEPEPTSFAASLASVLKSAEIATESVTTPNACDARPARIVARDDKLLKVLTDFVTEATGQVPSLQPEKKPYGPEDAVVVIGR